MAHRIASQSGTRIPMATATRTAAGRASMEARYGSARELLLVFLSSKRAAPGSATPIDVDDILYQEMVSEQHDR